MATKGRAKFVAVKWCGIRGCGTSVQAHEFACLKHWNKIPKELRDRITELAKEKNWIELIQAHNEARAALAAKGIT